MLLKEVELIKHDEEHFPYTLSFFNQKIDLNAPVIILVGENGSGKSTLLELVKEKLNLFQIGKPVKAFKNVSMHLKYKLNKPKGFYFSSEDFTTYINEIEHVKNESLLAIKEVDETYANRDAFAKMQAKGPHAKTLYEINNLHDRNLSESSHGQAYLSFFESRIRKNQLMLLDEPETPLSFQNQLTLLYLIKESVEEGSQFIIATHSPIMMAYPDAIIYEISEAGIKTIQYDEIESVSNMKSFLNHPKTFLRHLFK